MAYGQRVRITVTLDGNEASLPLPLLMLCALPNDAVAQVFDCDVISAMVL